MVFPAYAPSSGPGGSSQSSEMAGRHGLGEVSDDDSAATRAGTVSASVLGVLGLKEVIEVEAVRVRKIRSLPI